MRAAALEAPEFDQLDSGVLEIERRFGSGVGMGAAIECDCGGKCEDQRYYSHIRMLLPIGRREQ